MGRYLDLARQVLADPRFSPKNADSYNVLEYDINDINDKRVSPLPWDDPVVRAARAEAERLGVLGKTARGLNARYGLPTRRTDGGDRNPPAEQKDEKSA